MQPEIGKTYIVKHSSGRVRAKLNDILPSGIGRRERYLCTNLVTGREITLKSKQKFLSLWESSEKGA